RRRLRRGTAPGTRDRWTARPGARFSGMVRALSVCRHSAGNGGDIAMTLHIVRLGTARLPREGLRIGAVRHLPRGVRQERYAADDWFDVWYPDISPSAPLVKRALMARTDAAWRAFVRAFRAEMGKPTPRHALDLLAALSHRVDFSVGCYCKDESRCHRSVL